MRAVYHCKTCDFRLPYCVRSDRRFCQERCRTWWHWHPGRKRFDFSPGGWGLPEQPGKGQPKNLAAALRALAAARKQAADLDAVARTMQLADYHLRSKLTEMRDAAVTSRRELMKEIEALQDELEKAQQESSPAFNQEAEGLREQVASLTTRLKKAEDEAAELRPSLERVGGELATLRSAHERQTAQHAEEVRLLKAQAVTTNALRDHLNRQHAEALRSRDEVRSQLEKKQQDVEAKQVSLTRLSAELAELREVHQQHAAQHAEEVRKLKSLAAGATARGDELDRRQSELVHSRDELSSQLEKAKHEATERQTALDRANTALTDLRTSHAQATESHAHEVRTLKSQAAEQVALYEEERRSTKALSGQLENAQAKAEEAERLLQRTSRELTEQRSRAEKAESGLTQREADLKQERRLFAAAEQAHRETHMVAESDSRSLRAEKTRRIAAEQRVEELTRELVISASENQDATRYELLERLLGRRDDALAAELREIRVHRDEVVLEREQLSARILKLMAPGQYLELAARAGYDLSTDPLIQLKRQDVVVEDRLGQWQERCNKTERARRLDPEQTLDEQASAAAMAYRWKYVNHPHNWQKEQRPKWIIVGFLLDKETEQYLLKISQRRIERMKKTTQELMEAA